jgi:hypothetical protein
MDYSESIIPLTLVPASEIPQIIILSSFLLGFSYIVVALRFWTRIFIIRTLGPDDIFLLLALV